MQKNKKIKILVVGSLAYDRIMSYEGRFKDTFIKASLKSLSVSFGVFEKAFFLGGCGGNIARNFKKLGQKPVLVGIAGCDFNEYEKKLNHEKISTRFLTSIRDSRTASASVITDKSGNQLAFFSFGAQAKFKKKHFRIIEPLLKKENIGMAIISPTSSILINGAVRFCKKNAIPYFFDPGQAVTQMKPVDITYGIDGAFGLFANEYEISLIAKLMGKSAKALEKSRPLVCVTLGAKGSRINYLNKTIHIKAFPIKGRVDPTGAGDAFRSAFINSLAKTSASFSYKNFKLSDIKRAGHAGSLFASRYIRGKKRNN